MPDWMPPLIIIFVWLPIFGRVIAWWSDPDRPKKTDLGRKLGRLIFGKRWDYPLGKSFEERPARIDGDGSAAKTMESLPTSGTATDDGTMSETCIEVGTSLRAEDEPCLDPERCRRLGYCLRDPSDERYPVLNDGGGSGE